MGAPDFYLASSDDYELECPRGCWRIKRIATESRDDLLLIKVQPPLIGQKHGLGSRDIDTLLIAPRHHGSSLFPVSEWPMYVHVARPLGEILETRDTIHSSEIEHLAWAEIYRTLENARRRDS